MVQENKDYHSTPLKPRFHSLFLFSRLDLFPLEDGAARFPPRPVYNTNKARREKGMARTGSFSRSVIMNQQILNLCRSACPWLPWRPLCALVHSFSWLRDHYQRSKCAHGLFNECRPLRGRRLNSDRVIDAMGKTVGCFVSVHRKLVQISFFYT